MQEKLVEGVEPKRRRGHLRVAAILQTASDLFAEQGFDAVTMTAVAARSGAAIGSLYRFFPTKEALADALLRRFSERIEEDLAALAREAETLPVEAFADNFFDHALAWAPDRAAALALIEARHIGGAERERLRTTLRQRIAEAISRINPGLPPDRVAPKARVLQQLFKLVAANAGEGAAVLDELRALMRRFLKEQVADV
jgi:AcrR family transcriptional regulator